MSVGKIYTCTSNGALRLTPVEQNDASSSTTAVLPTRLRDWKLSHDGSTFAYGGDEVELSVWSIDGAFTAPASSASSTAEPRKRKRSEQLLPGEIWRAKNVANDNLDLRVPVHNTSLTYLHSTSSTSHHLVAGTQSGNVRRYDTRAARRPVADWKGMAKIGGVRNVHQGTTDNELFVSDCGCNLFAVDLRVGKIVYGYKGLAGAVASMTTHGPFLASAAQDRFVRLHSTHPPPEEANDRQENKGEVLEKTYVKVVPTIVVSDGIMDYANTHTASDAEDDADDDVWDAMENAEESDEDTRSRSKRARSAS
ncbi:hypothetical protein CERSUDRAFT_123112 [Gelatoporia subvermispora B]|uniref:Ribosome biogenesis protein NSA1 n=1 Tax=Ceriporiopsis subvermispora (strain B) TaxID=914234 RepID=M2QNA1_CERS8|nr:hypothetical protein CERSUDRAFT_123112 [Gelatoporia subvermispora B]